MALSESYCRSTAAMWLVGVILDWEEVVVEVARRPLVAETNGGCDGDDDTDVEQRQMKSSDDDHHDNGDDNGFHKKTNYRCSSWSSSS